MKLAPIKGRYSAAGEKRGGNHNLFANGRKSNINTETGNFNHKNGKSTDDLFGGESGTSIFAPEIIGLLICVMIYFGYKVGKR